ncbi:hypothetical protein AX17_001168 [Amanita inopinata Kibby_2008]|nr:hypothetical protein AX17_001168 [Amanita inopinata Kibby_2008]
MPVFDESGSSTPLSSSTATLAPSPSPPLNLFDGNKDFDPSVPASHLVEHVASRIGTSSTVYVYDVAEQVGFGILTKRWTQMDNNTAPLVSLQTRAGAGLGLVGRLSQGTSHDTSRGAVLTAYTTPGGLAMMAPSLSYLPPADSKSRLIMQVPIATPTGDNHGLSTTLASMSSVWPIIPNNTVVLISSSPQQIVDFARISYKIQDKHVIHLFDHQGSAREVGHVIMSPIEKIVGGKAVTDVFTRSGYSFFNYVGDAQAKTLVVLLNGPLALAAMSLARQVAGLAVVAVNVVRPWDADAFKATVPKTVVEVHVLDDVPNAATQGSLYIDTFESLFEGGATPYIRSHRITPMRTLQFLTKQHHFLQFIQSLHRGTTGVELSVLPPSAKKLFIFNIPQSPMADIVRMLEDLFLANKSIQTRVLTDHDVLSRPEGVTATRIVLSPKGDTDNFVPMNIALPFDAASGGEVDFLAILDHNLLKGLSLVKYAKRGSSILVVTPWTPEEFTASIPSSTAALVHERAIRIFTMNVNMLNTRIQGKQLVVAQQIMAYLAIMRLYFGSAATEENIFKIAQTSKGCILEGIPLSDLCALAWSVLEEVVLDPSKKIENKKNNLTNDLKEFESNAIVIDINGTEAVVNGTRSGSWHDAAKHLLFPSVFMHPIGSSRAEDYPRNPALRPEIPDRTYLATCTVNRRLTPIEYNRNVFHLEFDTSGTGLKYAIGEALGVHGWNDEQEVLDFCEWYGIDPKRLITIPVVSGEGKIHTRTVLQALQQQIDLFGKPPKSFYADLASYATKSADKHALMFIGSPEGSSTFKKLLEKDTVTFAGVLRKYPSAKPGIERLCEMIGDIQPRHYSIASSQAVVGNKVDLVVVAVDWRTPDGAPRYGQCTRYLAGLKVGQKVTVSIKPSVMKLPVDLKQPLIMAGLGTGVAPLRAFLQYLAWLREQGEELGPVYYYFGSRHQASEYLYGEEIESFILDGIITRAGLAFSRDQPKKVYIQHKMLEDSETLVRMLHDEKGVFYLCGPTWPVPDVYEALSCALTQHKGMSTDDAAVYLEGLKEEERYVLEVY